MNAPGNKPLPPHLYALILRQLALCIQEGMQPTETVFIVATVCMQHITLNSEDETVKTIVQELKDLDKDYKAFMRTN